MIEPASLFDIRRVHIHIRKERGCAIYLFSLRKERTERPIILFCFLARRVTFVYLKIESFNFFLKYLFCSPSPLFSSTYENVAYT